MVGSHKGKPDDNEVAAVGAACSFLHVTFNILPLERIMTVLAYRTELVPILWNFMKRCHENDMWSSLSGQSAHLPVDTPGEATVTGGHQIVDCHFKTELQMHIVKIRKEDVISASGSCNVHLVNLNGLPLFYVKPSNLSYTSNKCEALWQILWLNPVATPNFSKSADGPSAMRRRPIEFLQHRVCVVASELMSQLQDWNNRREFTSPNDFNADGASDLFMSQSQLATMKERNSAHAIFTRNRFKIRRDHILEDAFSQLNALAEEDLRGVIRITFVNEFGVEEAGMMVEEFSKISWKTLLEPHLMSSMDYLRQCFEGILVDIPFATFFLSKLKQKYNYLNDLPSLDPELYRHLIFLKIRQQSSHFLRGFQQLIQKDWIDMFKRARTSAKNLDKLVSLDNNAERKAFNDDSSCFAKTACCLLSYLLLISGSGWIDVDDLRAHTNYTEWLPWKDHYVIEMFWEVIQNLSLKNKRKFLKFATGCSRGPLLGFKYLEPTFCIQRTAGNASEEALDRLPTSATCMNLLKLPPYRSKQQMEQKLLYAINSDAGFDLS
ncbi:UNVERIFIED_CONTAM: E3 ubiquitin-protein ligase UPL6 [Sesamum angustifolium]|uniref:HECT-type E3 ubiquitin transferase n=1 Tax=Sesamum angustifolium TaxID=2727405 RepID=A0AAW2KH53_9LAMI